MDLNLKKLLKIYISLLSERNQHLFAVWCIEKSLSEFYNDPRSVAAIKAKKQWLDGKISDKELYEARKTASSFDILEGLTTASADFAMAVSMVAIQNSAKSALETSKGIQNTYRWFLDESVLTNELTEQLCWVMKVLSEQLKKKKR